jgi:hypothetical protein
VSRRCLLFLFFPLLAHADLQWAATKVFTAADPAMARAEAQFTFTNTGNYPIKVTNTRTSCGCTAAVADSKPVPPGGTGTIDVSFKTLNRHGLYEEPIVIETNDPKNQESTIYLRVLVQEAVDILPRLLFWQPGEPLTPKVIAVSVTDGFKLKNLDAKSESPDVTVKMDTVKAGAEYKLTVTPRSRHVRADITVTSDVEGKGPRTVTAHVRTS